MDRCQRPLIILRYDEDVEREHFEYQFEADFRIIAFNSDLAVTDYLGQDETTPVALCLMSDQAGDPDRRTLLAHLRDRHPAVLRVLMTNTMPLNLLSSMLENGLVDRCFEKPLNEDLVRSHILTAALAPALPLSKTPDTKISGCSGKTAVLIVDDEPAATHYLARQLERLQDEFSVICAENATAALSQFHAHGDRIAVIMADQRMPGMQGNELLDQLKRSHPDVVRILTSAYGEVNVAMDAVNEGRIFRYRQKPWRASELMALFRDGIRKHRELVESRDRDNAKTLSRFDKIRARRQRRLSQTLSPVVDSHVVDRFLNALLTINTLPASSSHLRASLETRLESELIDRFEHTAIQAITLIDRASSPARALTVENLTHALEHTDGSGSHVSPDSLSLLELFAHFLNTLLRASGIHRSELTLNAESSSGSLHLFLPSPLRIYSHLLSPITRVSSPLLEQQVALLALYVCVARLNGEINSRGGHQVCELCIRLPTKTSEEG